MMCYVLASASRMEEGKEEVTNFGILVFTSLNDFSHGCLRCSP